MKKKNQFKKGLKNYPSQYGLIHQTCDLGYETKIIL